ncbi:hypothetical protein WA026_006173 [Henosepilachna vigintioctopunctata]|uniref:Uncharacterized protein n=1 Tax=Henosepilachna vigintioctopunctata TaxID=420089 RepID=A0AAW1TNU2_9CUCU
MKMDTTSEFLMNFHNLEGITLKEKTKSFNRLLATHKNITPDVVDSIILQLNPTTYLEETFRIEILLFFKRTSDLLSILIKGNEVGASKVIRQKWFIIELLETFSPGQFVEEIFSQLSVSNRTKILKRIPIHIKDENKIEEIFDRLHLTYGLKVAAVLLMGCSEEKIKEFLKQNNFLLSASRLKSLYDKNPSLITFYFDILKVNEESIDNYRWSNVFHYIANKDPVFFSELSKKFKIYGRNMGRQSTKTFLRSKRSEILEDPLKFGPFLRNDALVRELGEDFPKFYKKGLPKYIDEFSNCQVNSLLKYYAKNKQYDLFYNSFKEKYGKDLWDHRECMDESLIEFIQNKDEREKWIKQFDNRDNYQKYKPKIGYAMARCSVLKSDMCFEDDEFDYSATINERSTIFNTLISTCRLNRDYEALLNILKSFIQRHRNSDVSVFYNFLRKLHEDMDMKKLTEEHWKYINEIITLQLFKKQKIFFPIYVDYIKFMYLQQKPVTELILTLMKESPQILDFSYDNDEFQKMMLESYVNLLPQVEDKNNMLAVQIILCIMKWNKKHSNDSICVHDRQYIINAFEKLKQTEKPEPKTLKAFKYLICRQQENQRVSNLEIMYWENFKNLNDNTLTKWFLKYNPELLRNNLDKVGIMLKNKNVNLIRNLKKYDHLDIPSKITKLCLEELETAESSKRERVVKILIPFMSSKEFILFFKEHTPKVDKVDASGGDEDVRKFYEIQCALAKHLKLRNDMKDTLPDLLKYCRGDVLSSALTSLYSSFYRTPENQLQYALEELNGKAVSVRKHTIFLTAILSPVTNVIAKYRQIEEEEKNISLKQHMFLSCYKYFIQNKIPECWTLLKKYIDQLKKQQKEVKKLLRDAHVIPKMYRADFVECVWQVFNKLKPEKERFDDDMLRLLSSLKNSDIMIMRDEFCMNVIENNLFDVEELALIDSVYNFMKRFVMYGDNVKEKIEFIFKSLRNFKGKFWDTVGKKGRSLRVVNKFCYGICEDLLKDDNNAFNTEFPKLFREAWQKEFTIDETFEEYLFIDFMVLKFDSAGIFDSLPQELSKLYSNCVSKYGSLIISNFKNFLTSCLRVVLKDKDYNLKLIKFLDDFIEAESSPEHCALVIELLPVGRFDEDLQIMYNKLIEKLLQKDHIVRIRLYGKLKNNGNDYYIY